MLEKHWDQKIYYTKALKGKPPFIITNVDTIMESLVSGIKCGSLYPATGTMINDIRKYLPEYDAYLRKQKIQKLNL